MSLLDAFRRFITAPAPPAHAVGVRQVRVAPIRCRKCDKPCSETDGAWVISYSDGSLAHFDCGSSSLPRSTVRWPVAEPAESVAPATEPAPPEPARRNDADTAVERLLLCLRLYPNYRVDSRGPRGLLIDAIAALRPDVAEYITTTSEDDDPLHAAYGHFFPDEDA